MGELWAWGPPEASQRVAGPALDFCLLVTRRRALPDLRLGAAGAEAQQWLDIARVARLLEQVAALIDSSSDPLAALLVAEGGARLMDRAKITQIAAVERDGAFAEKGYKTTTGGLQDLLGWDHDIAARM
jgi:acyl-CoA reductase-like NAD-dependent aldehyde dehydrogenase